MTTVARLSSPAQIVAALPLYLGYVPTESLVVACQKGPRGRIGLTMRFDLPEARDEAVLLEQVVARVRLEAPSAVLIVVYTSAPVVPEMPRALLVDSVINALDGINLTDALLVSEGRYFSYVCQKPRCCPPEGRAVGEGGHDEQVTLLAAELALSGRAPMPSRQALEASLAGPSFLAAEAAKQRCEAAFEKLLLAREEGRRDDWMARVLVMWEATAQRFSLPNPVLHPDDAAELAVALGDKLLRDLVTTRFEVPGMPALLTELCRRTPAPWDVPVCTLLAYARYLEGGGAEVTIALERALGSEPTYELALLIRRALLAQCPPDVLRQVTREVADDARLRRWAS